MKESTLKEIVQPELNLFTYKNVEVTCYQSSH